jgi:hypothetical protein
MLAGILALSKGGDTIVSRRKIAALGYSRDEEKAPKEVRYALENGTFIE